MSRPDTVTQLKAEGEFFCAEEVFYAVNELLRGGNEQVLPYQELNPGF